MKRLFFATLFLVSFFHGRIEALTLSEIRTEIRVRIKDTDSTRRRYTDSQLNAIVNQTQRDVINVSWVVKESTEIALVAYTTYYTLPTDLIAIERLTKDYKNLPETSLQELDSRFNNSTWATTNGTPDRYFQDPVQPDKVGVYPVPSTTTHMGTLRMNYFSQGTTLSSDSDEPFNGEDRYAPYHDLLIYDPVYKIMLLEGEAAKASEYRAYYEARLQILLGTAGNKPNFLPGFSGQRQ